MKCLWGLLVVDVVVDVVILLVVVRGVVVANSFSVVTLVASVLGLTVVLDVSFVTFTRTLLALLDRTLGFGVAAKVALFEIAGSIVLLSVVLSVEIFIVEE